ncbi:hypothetical protein FS842_007615, partial [Serendipita sp. 407]
RKESPVNHYSVIFDLLTIPGWLPASISAKHSLPHHTAIEHPWNISHAVSSTSYSLSAVASYRILRTNALPPKQPRIFQPQYPSLFPSANGNRSREDDALLENAEQESAELGLACLLNTCNPLSTLALTLSSHFGTDSIIDYERIEDVCEEDESPASTSTTNDAAAANPVEITLVRHLVELPPASSAQQPLGAAAPEAHKQRFPSTRYTIKPDSTSSVSPIPSELVSRLQLSVELPAFVDVNEPSLDVCMRMRLLPESQPASTTTTTPIGRLRATHVEIDAEEHATFRTKRDEGYGGRVGVHFGDQQEQDQTTATNGPIDLPSESTGSAAPKRPSRPTWLNTADSSPASSSHSLSTGLAPILPAYSQLFHEDGEARIDATRGVPPVYRPSTPLGSSSVPSQSQQQLLPEGEVVISKPELVPVGTTVIDWEKIPSLI